MITLLLIGQMVLGVVCDKLFDIGRETVPVIDKVHWWIGRTLAAVSSINIILGILAYKTFEGGIDIPLTLSFLVSLVVGITAMSFGEIYLKKSTHVASTHSKFTSKI